MGDVNIVFRLMPESPEVDIDALAAKVPEVLPEGATLRGHEVTPIAFGLKALTVSVVVGDQEGWTDKLESAFGALPGIQGVEVTGQTLI